MQRILLVPVLVVSGLTALGLAPQNRTENRPAGAEAEASSTFSIDSVHSTALFRVKHLGTGNFYGRFNKIDGSFDYSPESEAGLSIDVSIPIESVDTNAEGLDRHLKSPDFFNAREFETMRFVSERTTKVDDDTYRVAGEITIHGVTKPLTAEIDVTGAANFGRGYRVGLETTFTVKRSEFGMMYGVENGMLGDMTKVIVGLEGVRQ